VHHQLRRLGDGSECGQRSAGVLRRPNFAGSYMLTRRLFVPIYSTMVRTSPRPQAHVYDPAKPNQSEFARHPTATATPLRSPGTAADDHSAVRIESPTCRVRPLLWSCPAWVTDQQWLSATEDLMSVKVGQCRRNDDGQYFPRPSRHRG
jgi:hypothetical protein